MIKNEDNGTLEVLLGELNTTILSIMKILNFTNSSIIDDNWIKAYASPFPNRDSCLEQSIFHDVLFMEEWFHL